MLNSNDSEGLYVALSRFVNDPEVGQPLTADLLKKIQGNTISYDNADVRRSIAERSTREQVRALEASLTSSQRPEVTAVSAPSSTRVGWLPSNPVNPANQTEAKNADPAAPNSETSSTIYPTDPDKQQNNRNNNNPNKPKSTS